MMSAKTVKLRRKPAPTRTDFEQFCPKLLECPVCNGWSIVPGLRCANCGEGRWDGFEWNDEGQYFKVGGEVA